MSQKIEEKHFEIRNATLKEACCNYGYELLTGPNKGDLIPNRKGAHYIHEDLNNSFKELDVLIAQLDGAFNHWAKNETYLSELEEREELENYSVSAFKIIGYEENKSIILYGEKYTPNGRIPIETPKIKFESNYLYIEELKERLSITISEVELYMEGKKAPELEQLSIALFPEDNESHEKDFETAKV